MPQKKLPRSAKHPTEAGAKKAAEAKKIVRTKAGVQGMRGISRTKKASHLKSARTSGASRQAKRIPEVTLDDWSEFEATVRRELGNREFVVRNFDLVTFDGVDTGAPVEVDSLQVVRSTGIDRRPNAHVWNAPGFDHEHDLQPTGKRPHEFIYAFWVDFRCEPYKASEAQGDGTAPLKVYDITQELTEHSGIIVYDSAQLIRASANEYWFRTTALDAALLNTTRLVRLQ